MSDLHLWHNLLLYYSSITVRANVHKSHCFDLQMTRSFRKENTNYILTRSRTHADTRTQTNIHTNTHIQTLLNLIFLTSDMQWEKSTNKGDRNCKADK